jgi:hypothetical protein
VSVSLDFFLKNEHMNSDSVAWLFAMERLQRTRRLERGRQ